MRALDHMRPLTTDMLGLHDQNFRLRSILTARKGVVIFLHLIMRVLNEVGKASKAPGFPFSLLTLP